MDCFWICLALTPVAFGFGAVVGYILGITRNKGKKTVPTFDKIPIHLPRIPSAERDHIIAILQACGCTIFQITESATDVWDIWLYGPAHVFTCPEGPFSASYRLGYAQPQSIQEV